MTDESGGGERVPSFAGEAVEDGFARRDFDEAEDGQREQDQDDVGEPGVQGGEVKAFGHTVGMQKLEDIEVQQVEAVATLSDEEKRTPGEDGGDGVGTAEADYQSGEDWSEKASVHEEVGGVVNEGIEEYRGCGETQC